jgi:hypothetical protein
MGGSIAFTPAIESIIIANTLKRTSFKSLHLPAANIALAVPEYSDSGFSRKFAGGGGSAAGESYAVEKQ